MSDPADERAEENRRVTARRLEDDVRREAERRLEDDMRRQAQRSEEDRRIAKPVRTEQAALAALAAALDSPASAAWSQTKESRTSAFEEAAFERNPFAFEPERITAEITLEEAKYPRVSLIRVVFVGAFIAAFGLLLYLQGVSLSATAVVELAVSVFLGAVARILVDLPSWEIS